MGSILKKIDADILIYLTVHHLNQLVAWIFFFVRNQISSEELNIGKTMLKELVSMLVGLIKSNSDRVYEDDVEYKV